MALFQGEDMVDVTTPDGRSMSLPRSLVPASMMPQQIGTGGPSSGSSVPPTTFAPPPTPDPESVTGGHIPGAPDPYAPPAGTPAAPPAAPDYSKDYTVGTVDNTDATINKRNAVIAKQDKAAAARAKQAATPSGKVDAAANGEQDANVAQQQAASHAADVDAAGALVAADAYKTRNDEITKLALRRQQEAEADQAEQQKKIVEMDGLRKKIANTKIDRKAAHPILGAIAIALSGIGQAMQNQYTGKPIDDSALQIFWKSIDRNVAAQMANLDQQKDNLGLDKDTLAQLKEKASSRLALNNLLVAGAAEQGARQMEEIVARTSSDRMKAEGQKMVADIRAKGAELTMQAAAHQQEFEQKERFQKQSIGVQYAGLNQAAQFHKDDMQIHREEIAADLEKALAAERAAKGDAGMKQMFALQKENEERGIGNVATGDTILTQAGYEKLDQADKMAEEAKNLRALDAQSPDPAQRQMASARADALEQKSAELRGQARVNDAFRGRDPVQAGKLATKYSAAQGITTLSDEIQQLYDLHGRGYFSTDQGQAAIQERMGAALLQLKQAYELGVLSKNDITLLNNLVGGQNITEGFDTGNILHALGANIGKDPENFKTRLNGLTAQLQDGVINDLRVNQWDVKDPKNIKLFSSKKPADGSINDAAAKLQGETPIEQSDKERAKGTTTKAFDQTARIMRGEAFGDDNMFDPEAGSSQVASSYENSGSTKYLGLSKPQEQGMDQILTAYKSGDPTRTKVAAATLVQMVTDASTKRPALVIPLMHTLRDNAPDLYEQARKNIPPDSDVGKQLGYEESNRLGAGWEDNLMLARKAVVGDAESQKELSRRAVSGDKDAQRQLQGVINSKNRQVGK